MYKIIFTIGMAIVSVFAFAQCPTGQSEVTIDVWTDNFGEEVYWELAPTGSACGSVSTIFSGGNPGVGCNAVNNTSSGYADNTVIYEGPWCLTDGATYDIISRDGNGDGGAQYVVNIATFPLYTFSASSSNEIFSFTVNTPPTISNAFISQPIICYGEYASDEMQIEVNQTFTTTAYSSVIGYYASASYFVSYLSTNQNTTQTFNLQGFNANVDYFVRIVDSTAYYNGNAGIGSGTSTVGVYDEYGPINFSEPAQLVATTSVVASNQCAGDCIAAEDLTISGGTPPYSITINGITSVLGTSSIDTTYSNLCAGTYDVTIVDVNGCVSNPGVTSFTITESPEIMSTDNITACDSLVWNGLTYSSSGVYDSLFTSIGGCDSTAILNLTIANSEFITDSITICDGASVSVGTSIYDTSGSYTDTLQTANGCDSIINTTIDVIDINITQNDTTICFGDSIILSVSGATAQQNAVCLVSELPPGLNNGLSHFYPFCGNADDIVNGINGTLHGATLTTDRFGNIDNAFVFDGNDYIELNNTFYGGAAMTQLTYNVWFKVDQLPINTYTISGKEGYWKTISFRLGTNGQVSFGGSSSSTYFGISSPNNAYSFGAWHMATVTLSGGQFELFIDAVSVSTGSCNASQLEYQLHAAGNSTATNYIGAIHPVSPGITNYFIGSTDDLGLWNRPLSSQEIQALYNGNTSVQSISNISWSTGDTTASITVNPTQTTTYYVTGTQNGISCTDSVTVTVNQPIYSTSNITECDTYTWNGTSYTTSGSYTYLTTNASGCDSTTTLNLTINQSTSSTTNVTECDSYIWNGTTHTSSGAYTYSTTNSNGCDSTATLNLTINPSTTSTTNVTTCGNYTWIDGNTYTSNNNTATYSYNAVNGCDSVVTLNLSLTPNITNTMVDTACGEYFFGANFIDTSGTYNDTLTSVGGCDSIVTLELTIFEDSSVTYITACDSTEWNGVWYYNDTTVTDTGFVTTNSFGGVSLNNTGKEGNIWYFGEYAGIDFNSGAPVALTDGQVNTLEGCASIADANGDLLFYTDGMTVYNKNHIIMSNGSGLLGNNSSTQSAIIVKKPGSSTLYSIFTVDSDWSGNYYGTRFSEVDISLNGGLGEVLSATKNTLLVAPSAEKICAITHHNEIDIWIITHPSGSSHYYSYLLTSSGLNMTPIISSTGAYIVSYDGNNQMGYLRGSPNGELIANGSYNSNLVQVFDFNNTTGILSNPIDLTGFAPDSYGIEFSPNSELLYVSDIGSGSLYQFDLLAGTATDINNSKVHLGYCSSPGALQLAPDGKIYIAQIYANSLGTIDFPDVFGSGCSFNSNSFNLSGKISLGGLPTFYNSIFHSPPSGCDSVATAIIYIKNSSSTYTQVAQCDSYTWALNGQTYYTSQIVTIPSINIDGCQHIDSLDLMIYPEINVSAIITDELCVNYSDGSIMLNVSGGYGAFSYNWNGPNSFSATAKDIFNLSPGTYNLTITDITSLCIKDTFFVIGAGFDMQITSSSNDISCYGFDDGTIDINPINLINPIYTWSDISTSLEDRINMSPGIYYLQIDDNNCFVRDTFIITQPDSLFIISQQTTSVCLGSNSGEISVQAFGGTPGYDYYWSNWSVNSPINSNLSSGIYDLDIYDDNNCLFEETFEILPYQIIVSSVVDNIDCFGGSTGSIDLTVSGGFPTYTYLWSDNSINEDIYNLSAGSVTCTINDYLGCENIVSFNLTQEPQLSSIPAVTGVSCYGGSDGSASLLITGGVSAYNIDWNNADENNLEEGYYPYEITDVNGCTFNDTVYIPQEDSLILDIITIDLQCNGDPTGKIDAIVLSGGVYPYTYSWVGPNNFTANQYIINNLYAGLYILTVSDANSCDVEFQITLSQPTAVSQDIDFEFSNYSTYGISCMNGSDGWINATPTGGFIPYNFNWSGPNGFISTNQNITNLSEGLYHVTITNGLGCEEEFSFPMSDPIDAIGGVVNSLYDYNGYDVSCYGFNDGGIIVEANGGVFPYTYVWDNVQTLNPLPFQEAGMHLLTMYDNNGCEWESFIVLDQPDQLIWTIEMFTDTCEREVGAIKIELEGGVLPYNYLWNDGQTTFEANQLFEGEYNIQVIDKNGCQIFDTIQVSNLVAPKMDFAIMSDYEKLYKQLEDPIVFIDMTELTWQNALYWDWDFGDGTYGTDSIAFHSYQEIGEYDVLLKVTTDYNCIDTLVKKVIIEEYDLFIPNAFTPNSSDDNINEEFRPYGFGISEFQMNIYSRWGGLIYSTDNIEDGWNGKFDNSGAKVQLGVYVYYIKTKDVFGALHEYTGEVNLIR